MLDTNVELIAQLLRRAGFGANRNELEKYSARVLFSFAGYLSVR